MIDLFILAAVAPTNAPAITQIGSINFTTIISVALVCLAAFGITVGIWGNKKEKMSEENIRELPLVKQLLENREAMQVKYDTPKDSFSNIKTDLERLKAESANNSKSVEELKRDSREMVSRMDDILRQMYEFFSQSERI